MTDQEQSSRPAESDGESSLSSLARLDRQTGHPLETRALLSRPQLLGVLPTWWFWNDKEVWRLARLPFVVITVLAVELVIVIDWSLPLWAIAAIPALVFVLSLGLFERYLRGRVRARRLQAIDSEPQGELVEQSDAKPQKNPAKVAGSLLHEQV